MTPTWDYQLEFFANCTVDLQAEVIGPTPDGFRVNFWAKRGSLRGPLIDAEEVQGCEFVTVRPDGMAVLNKTATWRNRDGALIMERSTGMTDLGPDGLARISSGSWNGTPTVVSAPVWSTAHPNWVWLNRCQSLSFGQTSAPDLVVRMDVYLPSLGEQRSR